MQAGAGKAKCLRGWDCPSAALKAEWPPDREVIERSESLTAALTYGPSASVDAPSAEPRPCGA